MLDKHGQPITKRFNEARNSTRDHNELIGLCKGVLADNRVTQDEAEFLIQWIHDHEHMADQWPVNVLYPRIREMLSDGVLDDLEAAELLSLLKSATGHRVEQVDTDTGEIQINKEPATLPLTEVERPLNVEGAKFVLTGKFVTGSRSECEQEIKARGGKVQSAPTKATRYVVIGSSGSRDWACNSWGRKIQYAIMLKEQGHNIDIISEELWAAEFGLLIEA